MNAALEKLADMEKLDGQTKVWRNKVREMAYDIEDCIDVFMHHLSQGGDKDGLFNKTARKLRNLRVRHQIANKIQELKARVVEQSESRNRYKIVESEATPAVPPVDPRVQAMFEDAKRLVGIDGPREKITRLLMEENDCEFAQLKVVSIVGFGGLGKTTLANQVYTEIKNKFQCKAFVSVSRTPDMAKILKDMLSGVGYGTNMSDDVNNLLKALTEHLADKRYLIVIDDIWSIMDWNIIRCAFLQNRKGSRVITTTRIREVATVCCTEFQGHVHEMQPLNQQDSRSLFFKRLFNNEVNCPKQYIEISEDMLRKCRVLDLEVDSVGWPNSMCLDLSGISHLFLLRYLKVSGFRLKLPKKFGKLQHLMTLDMASNWLDSTNPSLDVTSSSSLRHLTIPSRPTSLELRNGVRKLGNLQTLDGFDISMNSVETIRDLSELTNLRHLVLTDSGVSREQDPDTRAMKHDTMAASLRRLGNSNLHTLFVWFSAPKQFWNHCFTQPHHLQSLFSWRLMKVRQVPKWMAQADRLAVLHGLVVEQLLGDDVQILAHMPCLTYLELQAQAAPEKSIIIHSKAFPVLKEFIFHYKSSCLTFAPGAMPQLEKLHIDFDYRAPEPEHQASPVCGIEHLASLKEVFVRVKALN
ncbi:unnamed protein product [Urochloa decumbens]|uniref:Uncharacterized protein n=1 Tax=Urochloa decumbens TaxID=240449 RepID=A0ABC8VK03_9POAL